MQRKSRGLQGKRWDVPTNNLPGHSRHLLTDFSQDQVLNRAENLVMVPVSFLGCISCTVLEAGAGVLAIGSAGKWKKAVDLVEKYSFSKMLLSVPFTRLFRVLNPWASIPNTNQKITEGGGLLSPTVRIALFDSAEHLSNSPNVFARHVGSRAVYLLSAGALSVTRAVDGIAGIILGALSFVTLGKIPSVNNWAFSALQAPGVINDLFRCAIRFIQSLGRRDNVLQEEFRTRRRGNTFRTWSFLRLFSKELLEPWRAKSPGAAATARCGPVPDTEDPAREAAETAGG